MRKATHKLTLTRDTLRQLDATTLQEAVAGNPPGGSFTTCCPSICVCPETVIGAGQNQIKTSPDA